MKMNEIMWEAVKDQWKNGVDRLCEIYEKDPRYTVIKKIENGELMGFGVFHDEGNCRILDGVYSFGQDKTWFLKAYREAMRGVSWARTGVVEPRMMKFFEKCGFKQIFLDGVSAYYEKGGMN